MFKDISQVVSANYDPESLQWTPSEKFFEYDDLWAELSGSIFKTHSYKVESLMATSRSLIFVSLIYALLTWYFDNVLL